MVCIEERHVCLERVVLVQVERVLPVDFQRRHVLQLGEPPHEEPVREARAVDRPVSPAVAQASVVVC